MPSNLFRKDGYLVDKNGSPITKVESENKKPFAIIAKCGHCGNGYFIPIVFVEFNENIDMAIESVKQTPRVKRDQRGAILDAFQISREEGLILNMINDHDPYLKGYFGKGDNHILERRVVNERKSETGELSVYDDYGYHIKTADEYSDVYAIEKFFAPTIQNGRLVYPKRINRKALIDEHLKQSCLRIGLRKHNASLISLYYQIYGKNNELGIIYKNGSFFFKDERGYADVCNLPEPLRERLEQSGVLERDNQQAVIESYSGRISGKSQIDKFNKRFDKFKKIQEQSEEKQPSQE